MKRVTALAFVATCAAGFPSVASSQQAAADEVRPRSLADSVFAVRLELDLVAEMIRRGSIHTRRVGDPQLAGAARVGIYCPCLVAKAAAVATITFE